MKKQHSPEKNPSSKKRKSESYKTISASLKGKETTIPYAMSKIQLLQEFYKLEEKLERAFKPTSSSLPYYSQRIITQYSGIMKIIAKKVDISDYSKHGISHPDNAYKIGKARYECRDNEINISGLGWMNEPFLVSSRLASDKEPIFIEFIHDFYTELRNRGNVENYLFEAQTATPSVKEKSEEEVEKRDLSEMNVGFKLLQCTHNERNLRTFIIVVAPSGFGSSLQTKIWMEMYQVTDKLQNNSKYKNYLIIPQYSYNLLYGLQGKFERQSAFDSSRKTSHHSLFDELLEEMLGRLRNKFPEFSDFMKKTVEILGTKSGDSGEFLEPKACSEKKIAQFEFKLRAIFSQVEALNMRNTILGESLRSKSKRGFEERDPCDQCLLAIPAFNILQSLNPSDFVLFTDLTESEVEVEASKELELCNKEIEEYQRKINQYTYFLKDENKISELTEDDQEKQGELKQEINKFRKKIEEAEANRKKIEKGKSAKKQEATQSKAFLVSSFRNPGEDPWLYKEASSTKSREKNTQKLIESTTYKSASEIKGETSEAATSLKEVVKNL